MDPLDFEEWRRQQAAKLEAAAMTPTDPTAGLPQAFAADRADRSSREALQGLNNSTSLLLGRQPFKVADPSGDAVKEWVMSRKVAEDAASAPLNEEWKRAQITSMTRDRHPSQPSYNPDNEPAPPEWGAPEGMTKRQAIQGGWAKKPAPVRPPAPRPMNEAAAAREERAKAGATYGGKYFKLRGDVPPGSLDEVELRKVREASGEVADLAAAADEVKAIYQRTGGVLTGPDAARMRSLITDMQLTAKGPSVYQLGVLAGPDMAILDTMLANPAKLDSVLKNAGDLRDFVAEIDTFKRRVLERTASKADALGFDPIGPPYTGVRRPGGSAGAVRKFTRGPDGKLVEVKP